MLTRSQIAKASADAQIAFCLDKQPTYEVAIAREIEALMLSRIAELQETNALNNKVIDAQHRAMVNAEQRGVAKGIEESAERIAALKFTIEALEAMEAQQAEAQEPVYQVKQCFIDDPANTWRDASEDAYHLNPETHRRVLFTRPQPAQLQARIAELESQLAAVAKDAERLDWIAVHGSFGVDSASGSPGGNGMTRKAATRSAIDAAIARTKDQVSAAPR